MYSITYRVFRVVLDGVLYLSIRAVVDVCRSIFPIETREDSGAHWCQLKTQHRMRISVSFAYKLTRHDVTFVLCTADIK